MFIKNLIKNIQYAVECKKYKDTKFEECADKRREILPLESDYEMSNIELENQIGKSICGVECTPEDWLLGSPMGLNFADNELIICERFNPNGPKCMNKDCPVYTKHCAYFDAKSAHESAIVTHNNAIRRIFGIKEK